MFPTRISISNHHNDSNSFFCCNLEISLLQWVSTKYYSIHHNRVAVGIIYHLQWFWDKKGLTALIAIHAELNFGINISIWVFQVSVLPCVIPRNLVLKILAIFLFSWVIYKSIKEIFLFTNCIKCVLSIFSNNKLVLNQVFIPWKILITLSLKFVELELVMIMLVSSVSRTILVIIWNVRLVINVNLKKAVGQVTILEVHHVLFHPNYNRGQEKYYVKPLFGVFPQSRFN
jgi:hypothetical protein